MVMRAATILRSSLVRLMPATHSACSTISGVMVSTFGCAAAVAATARWNVVLPIPRAAAAANSSRRETSDDMTNPFALTGCGAVGIRPAILPTPAGERHDAFGVRCARAGAHRLRDGR